MSNFGKRFKKLRKEKGLTQKELADKFNSDETAISKYENNHSTPDIKRVEEYADFFGVSVDYLLGRTDIKNPDIDIPDGVRELLSKEENEFIIDLLNKEGMQLFLRESRGASDEDLATAVRVLKAVREGEEKGTEL